MRYALTQKDLLASRNAEIIKKKKNEEIVLPETFIWNGLPVFIRDFAKDSVRLQVDAPAVLDSPAQKSLVKEFKDFFADDFKDYEKWRLNKIEQNQEAPNSPLDYIHENQDLFFEKLREKYAGSQLAEINFGYSETYELCLMEEGTSIEKNKFYLESVNAEGHEEKYLKYTFRDPFNSIRSVDISVKDLPILQGKITDALDIEKIKPIMPEILARKPNWIEEAKQYIKNENQSDISGDYLEQLYALLILDAYIREKTKNLEEYKTVFMAIINSYSQLMAPFVLDAYTEYLEKLGGKLFCEITTSIRVENNAKVFVRVDQEASTLRKPFAPEPAQKLLGISAEFELSVKQASPVKIQTDDSIHIHVLMGYSPEGLGFAECVKDGKVAILRDQIDKKILFALLCELKSVLKHKSENSEVRQEIIDLRVSLKPLVKTLINEVGILAVTKTISPDEIRRLTSHIHSTKACFEAADLPSLIISFARFNESTAQLTDGADEELKKRMGTGNQLGKIGAVSLGIASAMALFIGIGVCFICPPAGLALSAAGLGGIWGAKQLYDEYKEQGVLKASKNFWGIFNDKAGIRADQATVEQRIQVGELLGQSEKQSEGLII
jgi:hypothetical protein